MSNHVESGTRVIGIRLTRRVLLLSTFGSAVTAALAIVFKRLGGSDDGQMLVAAQEATTAPVPSGVNPPSDVQTEVPDGVPMSRGDAARTGVHVGPGPEGLPRELWRLKTQLGSSLVASGDALFARRSRDEFLSVNSSNGLERWSIERLGSGSAPAILKEFVYSPGFAGGDDANVYAVDASTGQTLWTFYERGVRDASDLVVSHDSVYFTAFSYGDGGILFRLDSEIGRELWRTTFEGDKYRPYTIRMIEPAIGSRDVFVADNRGFLYAINQDGGESWTFTAGLTRKLEYGIAPMVADGKVFFAVGEQLSALDETTGAELWRVQVEGSTFGVPAYKNGMLYVSVFTGDGEPGLLGVDARTGQDSWRGSSVGRLQMIADEVLYVTSGADRFPELVALDISSGEEMWRIPLEEEEAFFSSLAILNHVIYVSTTLSLTAYGGKSAEVGDPNPGEGIEVGSAVVVSSPGVGLRAAPSSSAVVVEDLPKGTSLVVTGSSEDRDNLTWWPVENPATGNRGFVTAGDLTVTTTS